MGKQLLCRGAVGGLFVGALLQLFFIALLFGIGPDVGLLTETERPDDGEWHLAHAELDGHGGEMALEGEVHQGGVDDVVLMMTEGNLRTAKFLGQVEELLAALPGAEKAGGLIFEMRNEK